MTLHRAVLRIACGLWSASLLLSACAEPEQAAPDRVVSPAAEATAPVVPQDSTAAAILARARSVHGADVLDHAAVAFAFRGTPFTAERDGDRFTYGRTGTDSLGRAVRDVLDNDGFRRIIDGAPVPLSATDALAAEGAVNSVVYFALLPYPLGDSSVQPRFVGTDTVEGEPYNLIEVTFRPEGGGQDYQDRFLYWFHRDRATMDYLAYSYDVNGGGTRFRKAVNPRMVGGVRFADYLNYTPEPLEPPLEALGRMYEADSLHLLSEIVLDSVRVVAR